MTSPVSNDGASVQTTWFSTVTAGIGAFIEDFSSRNAANDDIARVPVTGSDDVAAAAADPHVNGAAAIWAA